MTQEKEQARQEATIEEEETTQEVQVLEDIVGLKEKLAELQDGYGRLQADFDNYRRRSRQEMGNLRQMGASQVINRLLPVIDDLERAVSVESTDTTLCNGVQMVYRQLLNTLKEEGLTPIEAKGEAFDPNIHEAVTNEGEGEGEDVVLEELRRGYYFKDKLLRPSMVTVGKQVSEGDDD